MGKKSLVWLLLGGMVLTAAWGVISRTSSDVTKADKSMSAAMPSVAPSIATAPAPTEVPPATTAIAAATIINVDENSSTPNALNAKSANAEPLANALEVGVQVPSNAINSALNAVPASTPAKIHAPAQTTQRAEPVKVALERAKTPAPVAPAAPTAVAMDNDVSLISALVAHNEAEPRQAQPAAPNHTKRAAKQASPDIVERRAGDSTANLVRRCKRLGGTEAKLCQRRICAGHSGDAACKAK